MDQPPELQHTGHWRMAVWALRVGYIALAVANAVGVMIWLVVVAVTLTGFVWARHELPEPRPRFWSMRFMPIHDTVHALSSAKRS
jgi:hypothetical protein